MTSLSQKRIAGRLLVYILLFSGVVTLVITSVQLKIEYNRDVRSINEQFVSIERSFMGQLSEALWFFNEKSLKLHLEGIHNLQDIERLELVGEGGINLSVGQKHSAYTMEKQLPIFYTGENVKREVGQLTIVASMSNVYSRLLNRLLIILISQSLKTFMVSIFIYFLFHLVVIRHLDAINTYLKTYEAGKTSDDLKLNRKHDAAKDELDLVVDSLNLASKKLRDSYESLEQKVDERTKDLQTALEEVKTLSGLLPICAHCKKIRDDQGYWNQIEEYISDHADVHFSHGICDRCMNEHYSDYKKGF